MFKLEISAETPEDLSSAITGLAQQFSGASSQAAETKPRRAAKKDTVEAAEPEKPAETEVKAEAEKPAETAGETKTDESKLTNDAVKAHTIENYLNACFEKQSDRTDAFKALLGEFEADKFGAIPDDKLPAVKARVDALIAEKLKA